MKKLIGNKYLLILNLVLLLIGGSVLIYNHNINKAYKEEMMAPDVEDSNYDKMKISYVTIKERKTGLPTFDSVSDMDGHDASEEDNYIRTYDQITYVVEVGIDRNENTTTQTDVLKGGKIKVKVTIPTDDGLYMNVVKDSWMQNVTMNANHTELTATYVIPSEKMAAGGTQQLSFTIGTMGKEVELSTSQMPKFEVWMEGNKPDNSDSLIDSVSKHDSDPLIITGRIDPKLTFYTTSSKNRINNPGTLNGVKGQYINFFSRIYSNNGKGTEDPVEVLSSTFKIEYRYKNIDQNTDWINLDTIEGIDPINNAILYSYGRPCEPTEGYWPSANSNTPSDTDYCAYGTGTTSIDNKSYWYEYDSGVMTATQDGVNVNFSNENFYCNSSANSSWRKKYASQGFELFVPWYEPTPGRYEYEIKIIDTSLTVKDHNGQIYNVNPNQSATFTFKNELGGNISYTFSGQNTVFTDVTEIPVGNSKYFYSDVNVSDGPYEGGMERLIVWNSNYIKVDPSKTSYPSISYSNYGGLPTPSTSDVVYKYGVYKANPSEGVTTDELVNASKFEDFDWYDTRAEALEHGVIAAIRADEPKWQGNNINSKLYSPYFIPKDDLSNIGKTGIVRFWAYIYSDEARTHKFVVGDESNYIGAVVKEDRTGLESSATPVGLGQTYIISGITLSISSTNTDYVGSSRKTNYSVEDEVINMQISPSFGSGIAEMTGVASFKVEALIPKDLSFVPDSSDYEPTSVTTNSSGVTTVIWEFNDWDLANKLPKINYQVEISSRIPNNSYKTISSYLSSPSVLGGKIGTSVSFTISNLAGSSIRRALSKYKVEINEEVTINDYIYNIAQAELHNFKTVELLPKNGDSIGSHYDGSYTIKVISLANTQKMFYTTNSIDNIGLTSDSIGRMHIQSVDLENDSRWIEVHVNDVIPSNATAIASYIPLIDGLGELEYELKFIPVGNNLDDKYYFQLIGSSDNLENSVSSGIKQLTVIDRGVNGFVFQDSNDNGVYDSDTDQLLANKTVKLYDENNNLVKETITDDDGRYDFIHFASGNYYIMYELNSGMEFVDKNVGEANVSSVINKDTGKSDIISELSQASPSSSIVVTNQNIGIKYKPATVTVHHYIENTTSSLCDDEVLNLKYNDMYTVDSCTTLSDANYTYRNVVNNGNGEQNGTKITGNILQDAIEITYYYTLKPGQIVVHYLETGTNRRLADDIIGNGLVSQEFIHEAKEFEGYKLVKSPGTNKTIFKEDTQEVIYEYEKLKYNVDVEVSGGVGTITGKEIVFYGEDSTKDYIVITPGDGYEIESLSVNGKEVGLVSRDEQTLENLKDVKEDYLIKVSFREKAAPVPRTSKSSHLLVVASIFIALNLIGFVYFKFRHND